MSNSINVGKVNNFLMFSYSILTYFFIPYEYNRYICVLMIAVVTIQLLMLVKAEQAIRVRRFDFVVIIGVVILTTIVFNISSYSQFALIKAWIIGVIAFISMSKGVDDHDAIGELVLWLGFTFLLVLCVVISKIQGNAMVTINGTFNNTIYTDLIFTYYMFYSYKMKHYSGVLFALLFRVFFSNGRGMLLLIGIFFIMLILKKIMPYLTNKLVSFLRNPVCLFGLIIISTIIVLAFSYYWAFTVSSNGVGGYRSSLNDMSNRVRALSNIYAYQLLLSDRSFLWSGYGGNLRAAMGIDNGKLLLYYGARMVVPHNSYINILLSFGIIPGLIYIGVISYLLSRMVTYENIEIFIAMLIFSMILYIIPLNGLELFWFYLLMLPSKEYTYVQISFRRKLQQH